MKGQNGLSRDMRTSCYRAVMLEGVHVRELILLEIQYVFEFEAELRLRDIIVTDQLMLVTRELVCSKASLNNAMRALVID